MSIARYFKDGVIIKEFIDGVEVTENIGKPKSDLPSIVQKAANITAAAGKAFLNPNPVSKEERERRLAICMGTADVHKCDFYIDGRCAKCGCAVKWKVLLEAWHCPINKW